MSASEHHQKFEVITPKSVYPPREDTLFLASCIPEPKNGHNKALEIGSGSGFLSMTLAEKGWKVTSIDVNPLAVAATKSNSVENGYLTSTVSRAHLMRLNIYRRVCLI